MKNIIILISITVIFTNTYAQDAHSSQIYMDAMGLNPALTGSIGSKNRIVAFYRNQWSEVLKSSSYQTYGFAWDSKACIQNGALSYGFRAVHEEAGVSRPNNTDIINLKGLRTSNLTANVSYTRNLDKNKRDGVSLSIGFALGWINRYLNDDYLRFDEQFDGFGGYDGSLYSYEEFDNYNINLLDIGAGIALTQNIDPRGKYRRFDNWMIGIGFSHVHNPDYNFQDSTIVSDTYLPMRVTPYAQTTFYLFGNHPTILYTGLFIQRKYFENIIGFDHLLWFTHRQQSGIQLGLGYRQGRSYNTFFHPDALISTVKLRVDDRLVFGMSYDLNISGLSQASRRRGGPEIVLEYRFGKTRDVCVNCPWFGKKHRNGFY